MEKFELKKLVEEDLAMVFAELETILNPQEVKINEFINLKGRHKQLEGDRRKGILSTEEYYREQNILRWSCLGLIDELSDVTIENYEEHENFKSKIENKEIPRLEVELVPRGKWKSPKGLSRNNKVDENGAVWIHEAIYINEIGWKFKIVIRNNSSYPAFYPELEFSNGRFNQIDNLNKNKAIKPFEEIELNAKYSLNLEAKGADAIDYMNARYLPDELNNLTIFLNYENERKEKITTKFHILEGNGYNEITNNQQQ